MMTYLDALILGIVEGITEFLPVSSTGHMILVSHVLNIGADSFTKSFEIIIQLGAILAVVYMYREKIFKNMNLMFKVCVAFLPTAVIGLALYSFVKKYLLGNVYVVIGSLLLGGLVILYFEKKWGTKDTTQTLPPESEILSEDSISIRQALYIGLFQAIAIIPGVSRSAATIIGGQILGLSRKMIVEFSFLLAIPVMCAATALDIYKHHESFSGDQVSLLIVGFVTAFLVAILAIKTFLSYIQKHSFSAFGVYRIILAFVFLGVLYFM